MWSYTWTAGSSSFFKERLSHEVPMFTQTEANAEPPTPPPHLPPPPPACYSPLPHPSTDHQAPYVGSTHW